MKINKFFKSFNIYLTVFLINQSIFILKIYAKENYVNEVYQKQTKNLKDSNKDSLDQYIKVNDKNNFYILGAGDIFNFKLNELNEIEEGTNFSGNFEIDNDGIVNFPRIKRVKVGGLTIKELTDLLNKEFSFYVKNVDVSITISKYRPAKIYLDGAVKSPGLHLVNIGIGKSTLSNFSPLKTQGSTVYDALKIAGGVSLKADLSNIEITRINSLSNGGGRIKTTVNLFETLELKDPNQNINLKDGDTIFIPTVNDSNKLGFNKILKSNINPKFIKVYISGRVKEPGIKEMFYASTLVDSINISGGAKIIKGKVKFLRYNNDGSVDNRVFRYNKRAKRGSYKNPYLSNGDIIFVGESALSITSEVLNEITDPLKGILSTYSFFKIIND